VLNLIRNDYHSVLWINLREEPLLYIKGVPYVLRDSHFTLRNINSYSGISFQGLEIMESKLKLDVATELKKYEGKILLHAESTTGEIIHSWEQVQINQILSMKEAMELVQKDVSDMRLIFKRSPQTAERVCDASDFDDLVRLIANTDISQTAIVL
jgi:hypothetical protein